MNIQKTSQCFTFDLIFKYQSTGEFIRDVRRMFRNCREFWNQMDSDGVELFMGHADRMEDHFDERLEVIHSKNFQFVEKNLFRC